MKRPITSLSYGTRYTVPQRHSMSEPRCSAVKRSWIPQRQWSTNRTSGDRSFIVEVVVAWAHRHCGKIESEAVFDDRRGIGWVAASLDEQGFGRVADCSARKAGDAPREHEGVATAQPHARVGHAGRGRAVVDDGDATQDAAL